MARIEIARQETLLEVKVDTEVIGKENDAQGTASTGTVMGKLNKVIQDGVTSATNWTPTRAVKLDTLEARIGTANDTGEATLFGVIKKKSSNAQKFCGLRNITSNVPVYGDNFEVLNIVGSGRLMAIRGLASGSIYRMNVYHDDDLISYSDWGIAADREVRPAIGFRNNKLIDLQPTRDSGGAFVGGGYFLGNGLEFNKSLRITASNKAYGHAAIYFLVGIYE